MIDQYAEHPVRTTEKTLPLIEELIDRKPFRITELAANTVSVLASRISDNVYHDQLPERVLSAVNIIKLNRNHGSLFHHTEQILYGIQEPIRGIQRGKHRYIDSSRYPITVVRL